MTKPTGFILVKNLKTGHFIQNKFQNKFFFINIVSVLLLKKELDYLITDSLFCLKLFDKKNQPELKIIYLAKPGRINRININHPVLLITIAAHTSPSDIFESISQNIFRTSQYLRIKNIKPRKHGYLKILLPLAVYSGLILLSFADSQTYFQNPELIQNPEIYRYLYAPISFIPQIKNNYQIGLKLHPVEKEIGNSWDFFTDQIRFLNNRFAIQLIDSKPASVVLLLTDAFEQNENGGVMLGKFLVGLDQNKLQLQEIKTQDRESKPAVNISLTAQEINNLLPSKIRLDKSDYLRFVTGDPAVGDLRYGREVLTRFMNVYNKSSLKKQLNYNWKILSLIQKTNRSLKKENCLPNSTCYEPMIEISKNTVGGNKSDMNLNFDQFLSVEINSGKIVYNYQLNIINNSETETWPQGADKSVLKIKLPASSVLDSVNVNNFPLSPEQIAFSTTNSQPQFELPVETKIKNKSEILVVFKQPLPLVPPFSLFLTVNAPQSFIYNSWQLKFRFPSSWYSYTTQNPAFASPGELRYNPLSQDFIFPRLDFYQ